MISFNAIESDINFLKKNYHFPKIFAVYMDYVRRHSICITEIGQLRSGGLSGVVPVFGPPPHAQHFSQIGTALTALICDNCSCFCMWTTIPWKKCQYTTILTVNINYVRHSFFITQNGRLWSVVLGTSSVVPRN